MMLCVSLPTVRRHLLSLESEGCNQIMERHRALVKYCFYMLSNLIINQVYFCVAEIDLSKFTRDSVKLML